MIALDAMLQVYVTDCVLPAVVLCFQLVLLNRVRRIVHDIGRLLLDNRRLTAVPLWHGLHLFRT